MLTAQSLSSRTNSCPAKLMKVTIALAKTSAREIMNREPGWGRNLLEEGKRMLTVISLPSLVST